MTNDPKDARIAQLEAELAIANAGKRVLTAGLERAHLMLFIASEAIGHSFLGPDDPLLKLCEQAHKHGRKMALQEHVCTQVQGIPSRVQLLAALLMGWSFAREDEGHSESHLLPSPKYTMPKTVLQQEYFDLLTTCGFSGDASDITQDEWLNGIWLASHLLGVKLVEEASFVGEGKVLCWRAGVP